MDVVGNLGGLLGTAVGFVILGEGIKLIRDSEREYYHKKGHKIHSMEEYHKYRKGGHKNYLNIYSNYDSFIPDIKIKKLV